MFRILCSTLALLAVSAVHADSGRGEAVAEKFADYRGQVVLVDFWASWCGPCRRSFPWMNAMQERYGSDAFTVVAVNVDQERAAADQFLANYPARFKILYDSAGDLARTFGVSTMPTSFVLDATGKVHSAHRGFLSSKQDQYEAAIVQALSDNEKLRKTGL